MPDPFLWLHLDEDWQYRVCCTNAAGKITYVDPRPYFALADAEYALEALRSRIGQPALAA